MRLAGTILFAWLFLCVAATNAQSFGFDDGVILPFELNEPNDAALTIVQESYKNGNSALQWEWTAPTSLQINHPVNLRNFRDGVIFWVYNEAPGTAPLVCEFRDANDRVQYQFNFGMNFTGWRICRIGSRYMQGSKAVSNNLKFQIHTPSDQPSGRLFIDRFSFVADVGHQNAPDAQLPQNNETANINHWNSLWRWSSENSYDFPPAQELSEEQLQSLLHTEAALHNLLAGQASQSLIAVVKSAFTASGIERRNNFWVGKPLVVKPDKTATDIAFAELGDMMLGFALDALVNNDEQSAGYFINLWEYALNQGFADGSAMGNNHHYGYETRRMFQAAFLMRDRLKMHAINDDVLAALHFWSGLSESRVAYDLTREGVVDTWNTLLVPRLIAALMTERPNERYRAVEALVRWVNGSLAYTPGNIGGLKPDGTVFHHAGHYPAYGIGGFAGLADFLAVTAGTNFELNSDARHHLAEALLSMACYTNTTDWSIGMSGRHPHDGGMSRNAIDAMGFLALQAMNNDDDMQSEKLVGEFLRLTPESHPLKAKLTGFTEVAVPQGFFVFNHAAAGVHRVGNTMVTIKGYNSDVWGSEIYTNDNRYGRYQSYGAVEIFNEGSPVSRRASRFSEAGWDWNRLPGTTTIHLPLERLESPLTSTVMARSKEDFAGASSLNGEFGVFGIKLWEDNRITNVTYTPDFKARKSVFTFGKRVICLGSDIQNSNTAYNTETTLFQQQINAQNDRTSVNGAFSAALGFNYEGNESVNSTLLSDLSGNYYRISSPHHVLVAGKEQISKHNKTRVETRGNFLTARLNHGKSPQGAAYEYMIMLKPTPPERNRWDKNPAYAIWQKDNIAHIVHDSISGVTVYVAFEKVNPEQGLVGEISKETLLMLKEESSDEIRISVNDPSLHLPEKTVNSNNTAAEGVAVTKEITVRGNWKLKEESSNIILTVQGDDTRLEVTCKLGIPVEFTLERLPSSVVKVTEFVPVITLHNNILQISGETERVQIFDLSGKLLASEMARSDQKVFQLAENRTYLLVGRDSRQEQLFFKKIKL